MEARIAVDSHPCPSSRTNLDVQGKAFDKVSLDTALPLQDVDLVCALPISDQHPSLLAPDLDVIGNDADCLTLSCQHPRLEDTCPSADDTSTTLALDVLGPAHSPIDAHSPIHDFLLSQIGIEVCIARSP